jgi:hypothetical protein
LIGVDFGRMGQPVNTSGRKLYTEKGFPLPETTQWPKWCNFEHDSYKMALKIVPAEIFFAKCSARIAPGYWGKKLYHFHYMYTKFLSYNKERFLPFVR